MRLLAFVLFSFAVCYADEGMWTFDNLPVKQLQDKYGFVPSKEWLDHVRLSSVRFNGSGSGSFVSADGLVLTNHHVASAQLERMSTAQHDYLKSGFYAATRDQEMKSVDQEVDVLESMEDVTNQVRQAIKPGLNDKQALEARQAAIARIEKDSLAKTSLRSEVVPLYSGAEFWLYRYKRYTDIRLVFAPEQQAAFFGGDPDNFTYPRYDLDLAIFRIYEDGKPLHTENYLRWNSAGVRDGELVFVSGNPASTERNLTVSQLESLRDYVEPEQLKFVGAVLDALHGYAAQGSEQARETAALSLRYENTFKVRKGELAGLKDPQIMGKKKAEETALRDAIKRDAQLERQYNGAWAAIAAAEQKRRPRNKELQYRTVSPTFAQIAVQIVRYVEEVKKPDSQRLPGYHDAQLQSLRFRLLSPAPVYLPMERSLLAAELDLAQGELGGSDPFVKAALNGASPAEAAAAALNGTKLADPAERKALLEGGEAAVNSSKDPLIGFARRVEPVLRETTEWERNEVQSVESRAGEEIGLARFAVYGKSIYPDATFTLRLSYGTVKGYPMNGTIAPYKTTFYGLFDRSASFDNQPPFDLTPSYERGRADLNLSTPFNFVSTADIIGGNSGSPVINRNGELVGLIFDGNIESLVSAFVYDDSSMRAVAVHPGGMMEAMRKLYHADALARELEGGSAR